MFAPGADEPIGQEHKGAVGPPAIGGGTQKFLENGPQTEPLKQSADEQDRAPGRRLANGDIGLGGIRRRLPREQTLELWQQAGQDILAPQVSDDALFDLAVLAKGLNDADVLIDGAAGGTNLDDAHIHSREVSRHDGDTQAQNRGVIMTNQKVMSLRFSAKNS